MIENGERGRLAGAGLGATQQVAMLQQVRNALFLDGRGVRVAFFVEGLQDGLDQSELVKRDTCHGMV
jgi:hypothetical protein